ncbi:FAS1-like dehydratase domain-containing protein [Flavisphingomonas formosensis]|uniref:FAS1-like dehydratase domain-containing protein n=1 Tax=Flavisphingomonas formosensis TaxID=861534 RepID=UPI0012F77ACB|nr:MaoC family dehydratase N-terminal domain-containing protein [Sphingomonas formosensis]
MAETDDGLLRNRITDESVELMRRRIGFPNPTLRTGAIDEPWNISCTDDAVRRFSICIGDDNPLFCRPDYARRTRWGGVIAPPAFEKSMGLNRNPEMDIEEARATSKALRGIQLFHSGGENFYYAPIMEGTTLHRSRWVANVEDKKSEFSGRSVIVTNGLCLWDQKDRVLVDGVDWFIHAERRRKSEKTDKYVRDEPARYTDEQLAEIEAAYDVEYRRGADTLWFEDVVPGTVLPRMVKGPLTVTDLINLHMGAGWLVYGNWPNRLAYENRKKLRGFYSRDEYNAWDTVQRVHWDKDLAQKVGVRMMYDIGPVRQFHISNYLTNFAGDDAWIHRIRFEFRRFNYIGDITWLTGEISEARIDETLGPLIEVTMRGTNQRGSENIRATATILLASRSHGPVKLPQSPPPTPHRAKG